MPNQLLDNLTGELKDLDSLVTATLDSASEAERDLTEAETETLTSTQERIAVITPQVEMIQSTQESRSAAMALSDRVGASSTIAQPRQPDVSGNERSMGDQFVGSDTFRDYKGGGRSAPVPVMVGEERAALSTTSTPIGADFMPQAQRIMLGAPAADYPLLGAIRNVPVSAGSIDVITYGSKAGAKTPAKVAEGSPKPEVVLTAEKQTLTLDTYAGWVDVTRQLLQDAPAVRAFVDSELRRGLLTLREKNVAAAIAGATIPPVTGAASQKLWQVIRTGIATVQMAGFRPNGVLMNPLDAGTMDLDLITAAGGGVGYPVAGLSPWGLQVITSPSVPTGKTYIGDFNAAVSLFRRTGVEIFITDSDGSKFISNIFTILGEERYVVGVTQPNALVEAKLHA